ncbi:PREDICTED: platelet endothelial aggregation receptor 1 [Ficedula albicollis]|uniref:platelet endothelial aggregation receptor 1 n=1 Tax=Ficedula albicollis TaxID=59894 RepID=UPI0007AD8400|nr:PREDICTED: platelet endothelial aggregation receptor 1 [Ficedula albicollis]
MLGTNPELCPAASSPSATPSWTTPKEPCPSSRTTGIFSRDTSHSSGCGFTAPVKESYTKPHVVSSSEPCPGGLGLPLPCPRQRVSPGSWRDSPTPGCPQGYGWRGGGTAPVKESYTKPHVVSSSEPCPGGLGLPLPCPRQRVVYRTEYRQAVRTDYRRRYQCCQGYYESRDSCVPHCSQECVHGRCVAPELCQCEPGWRGPSCSSECDERSWGPDCGQRCQCHHGAPCDPLTGLCSCPPGFTDPLCRQPCPPGTYGQGCHLSCPCHHQAPCNASTGACLCPAGLSGPLILIFSHHPHLPSSSPSAPISSSPPPCPPCTLTHQPACTPSCHPMHGECVCLPGWAGLYCNESCPPGYFGPGCLQSCLCLHGGVCDGTTGHCHCPPGYTDEHCSSLCPPNTFGMNCSGRCSCQHALACSPLDGSCFCKEGWHGPDCSKPCPAGSWGPSCNRSCDCAHGAPCDPQSGTCHCPPGWQGPRCLQPCLNGTFGAGCGERCACAHADGCDPVTGECHCLPGWTGPQCEQGCPHGSWGRGCLMSCSCRNGASCSPQDGSCTCTPGFRGPTCQRPCPAGRYGKRCSLSCSCANGSSCHPTNGSCLCTPGWRGPRCSQPCAPGTFGLQCEQLCHCPHNATCDPTNGTCPCAPGTAGPHCEAGNPDVPYTIEPAPPAAYSPLGMVLSLVAMVVLLVAVVVTALCYHHGQKGKERQHLAVAYRAGQTDTSDYMVPDVPPNHHAHYYSNPSYHTLSQCPLPAPGPQDRASSLKVPGSQLFPSMERPYSPEGNATLPPDWKHLGAPALGPRGRQVDRSYTYSHGLRKCESKEHPWEGLGASSSSLASENPYATIKELPPAISKAHEGSYMEMKSPVQREMSYAEIGLLEEPPQEESCPEGPPHREPPSHYDSPKNSHIPCHYDVPPARHYPPSPPLRRKDR